MSPDVKVGSVVVSSPPGCFVMRDCGANVHCWRDWSFDGVITSSSYQPEAGGRPGTPKISSWPKTTNDLDCHSTMQSFDPHFSQNSWPVALSWSQLRYSYQTPCATPTHQRRCCQPQTKTRLLPPPPTARHQARHGIVFRPINLCPIDWCRRRETERARVRRRPPSLRVCSGDQSLVAACPVGTHGGCDAEGP